MRLTPPFNLPAPGRCQTLYFDFTSSAEPCVFSKQSPVPGFCGSITGAPLLPKLRGQLAEFLNDSSPAHLSLLNSSTCVGFGYGRTLHSLETFPGSLASIPSLSSLSAPHQVSSLRRRDLPPLQTAPLDRLFRQPAHLASCVIPSFNRV